MIRFASFCLTFLFLCLTVSFAQKPDERTTPMGRPGGTMGPATEGSIGIITEPRSVEMIVHVVFPSDHPVSENVQVSLEVASGGVVATAFTNSQGQAAFHNLHAGSYVLRLKGADIKDGSSEQIALDGFSSYVNEYVYAHPANEDKVASDRSKGGVVSAADLNVPSKARKEFEKGNDAFAKGDAKKAIEQYERAVSIYPKYASAYNNLGAAYMKSGDKVQARQVWQKALAANPSLTTVNINLAKLALQESDYQGAVPYLEKALSADPKLPEALLLMANAKLMTGNMDEALLYARKVHETGSHLKFELSHLIAGRALEAQNHPDQARVEYELLLKESSTGPEAAEAQRSIARLDSVAKR